MVPLGQFCYAFHEERVATVGDQPNEVVETFAMPRSVFSKIQTWTERAESGTRWCARRLYRPYLARSESSQFYVAGGFLAVPSTLRSATLSGPLAVHDVVCRPEPAAINIYPMDPRKLGYRVHVSSVDLRCCFYPKLLMRKRVCDF